MFSPVAAGIVVGFGVDGYRLGIEGLAAERARPAGDPRPRLNDQPRPTNGIFVAMMVMKSTFDSSGRLAICSTA
jgi:hypothetical protein